VGDVAGVGAGLGGLAQGVGGVVDRQAVGIGQAGQVAVAGVAVAHGPGVGVGLEGLGHGQAALVVQVAVDDAAGAAVVVRGDGLGQAVGGVVPGLVAVVVGELQGADAVAGVVGADDLAGQDGWCVVGLHGLLPEPCRASAQKPTLALPAAVFDREDGDNQYDCGRQIGRA